MQKQGIRSDGYFSNVWEGNWIIKEIIYAEDMTEAQSHLDEKANIAVVDLDREWTVNPEELHSKSHNTVFKGEKLKGRNIMTITDGIVRYTVDS